MLIEFPLISFWSPEDSTHIYKEDNINGNRAIEVYKKKGLQSILESERIKKEILDFEQDMWNR